MIKAEWGVHVDKLEHKLGIKGSPTGVVRFENCHVPVLFTRLITAIPWTAPESTSVIFPATSVETRSPELVV